MLAGYSSTAVVRETKTTFEARRLASLNVPAQVEVSESQVKQYPQAPWSRFSFRSINGASGTGPAGEIRALKTLYKDKA